MILKTSIFYQLFSIFPTFRPQYNTELPKIEEWKIENGGRLFLRKVVVPSSGLEPEFSASEADALSVELRGQTTDREMQKAFEKVKCRNLDVF